MNKAHVQIINALAQVMPPMTHRTKKRWKGEGIIDRFPDLKDIQGNAIEKEKHYLVDVNEPINNETLLKTIYSKTVGDKIKGCIEAVKKAKTTESDKILHKTLDGIEILAIELAPDQPKVKEETA